MTVARFMAIVMLAASNVAGAGAGTEAGRLVAHDVRFDALVPADARLETLASDHQWLEGPLWDRERAVLLYSDIPANTIFRLSPGDSPRVFLERAGYSGNTPFTGREPGSNGLTHDLSNRLVICQHGDRRIVRMEAQGRLTVLADRYQGRRLNSPNDAVYRSNGDLYFTDPPFGLAGTFADPEKELAYQGVYRLRVSGELELLIRDIEAPNGIAFSPDERTLYVTDVSGKRPAWLAYPVDGHGGIGAGRVFYDATPLVHARRGGPDGLKTDTSGNVFAAGPEAVYVFAPDGTLLGEIQTGVPTANVAFGEDGRTLFIAASHSILRIRLNTLGARYGS